MKTETIEVGSEVRYAETFRGVRWTKVGTVVEVGEGSKAGRVRVLWDRWEYESGHVRKDGKRTWMAADRLSK